MEDTLRSLSEHDLTQLELIETLRFTAGEGYTRLDLHLDRMERSAMTFRFPFRRDDALKRLAEVTGPGVQRVRLVLRCDGRFSASLEPLPPNPSHWTVAISQDRIDARDPFLRHKTNRRGLYDRTRANLPEGVNEMIFCNREGRLCEGTITNIFLERARRLLTPRVSAGLLPGILRQDLLASGDASEVDLVPSDLLSAEAIFVGNSLRGLIPARCAWNQQDTSAQRP